MRYQNHRAIMIRIVPIIMLSLFASCTQNSAEVEKISEQEFLKEGEQITNKLAGTLMAEVSTQIKENGIIEAINYCSLNALPLTDSISKTEGVEISRVSHRYRNPKNRANSSELKIIDTYQEQIQKGVNVEPLLVLENSKTTYYSPILIGMPTCLKCHGKPNTDIDPTVLIEINKKYPHDLATGFEIGQLRGLFKVEFKADKK